MGGAAVVAVAAGAWGLSAPVDDWKIAGPFGGTATTVAVDPQSPKTVLAGAMNSLLYQSQDFGATWTALDLPKRNLGEVAAVMVDPQNSDHYFAGVLDAFGGGLFETIDGGKVWTEHPDFKNVGVRALTASSSNPTEFVAGTLKGVMMTTDSGKSWKRISDLNNLEMRGITAVAIDPKDPNTIYAGTPHLPWRTTDGGQTWSSIHSGMIDDSDVFSIYIDPKSPSEVFASACSGIYASKDRGEGWRKLAGIPNTSRRTHVIRESPDREGTIFAGTTMGLFRSPNGGTNWKVLTDTQVNSLAFDPTKPSTMYLAMEYDGVGKTLDGGDTINLTDDGFVDRQISAMTRAGSALVSVESSDGETSGVFVSHDDGSSWTKLRSSRSLGGVHLRSIVGHPTDEHKWIAASPRLLYKTLDGGATWRPLAVKLIVTPAKTEEVSSSSKVSSSRTHAQSRSTTSHTKRVIHTKAVTKVLPASEVYGLYAIAHGATNLIAAATESGLLLSDDFGETWTKADLGTDTPVYGLASSSGNDGRLSVKAQTGLYLSKDGGAHWDKSAFPLPVGDINAMALAADASAPILVATRLGLYSSPDSGVTWNANASGLNASTVNAVTYAAEGRSAFAVEYGQLFRSEDGGASWSRLPTSLHSLPIRQLAVLTNKPSRLYAITSGLGILFRD